MAYHDRSPCDNRKEKPANAWECFPSPRGSQIRLPPTTRRRHFERLSAPGRILVYFAGVLIAGALLAPWLFWGGRWIAEQGVLPFLSEVEFQKFFNRAALVAAVGLLWPLAKTLQIGSWRDLGLEKDRRWRQRFFAGFAIAAVVVAVMAAGYVAFGIYEWKKVLPWDKLARIAVSAIAVGLLEEALFRGALLGVFRRSMRDFPALLWITVLFAALHFLKPDESIVVEQVKWWSGFALLPHLFHQFAEPMTLLAGFTTIFILGWVLGYATIRTRSLWMAIGLHAGVVFVKMGFSKFTKREAEYLPWIGRELQIGLVPLLALALMGVLVWVWLNHVDRPHSTPRG